ncbi:MAG: sensor histidine kinase [Lentisphaerae bacterium]|nr:sensor histidine kinase [Lentisphaerota bacterium]
MRTIVSLILALAAATVQAFEVTVVHGKRTISGVVTFAEEGANYCFIHTDSGEWWRVGLSPSETMPHVGDIVDVSGEVLRQTVNNRIDWCTLAVTGHDEHAVPAYEEVTVSQLHEHPVYGTQVPDRFARLLAFSGKVLDINRRLTAVQMIVSDGAKSASVTFSMPPDEPLPKDLKIGATVRVKGGYSYVTLSDSKNRGAFCGISQPTLMMMSVRDLTVLSVSPFWTPLRVWLALGLAAFILLLLLIWVSVLRRTVARQVKVIETALRERAVAEGERRERLRLSHDLHDDFQQLLSGSLFRITAALNWMADNDIGRAQAQLEKARNDLVHTQSQLRAVLWGLKEESEGPSALVDLFRYAAGRMAHWAGKVEIVSSGHEPHLARTIAGALLMILQEAVGNALRHGKAQHVKVHVDFDGERLTLRIIDDGSGFDLVNHPVGLGLSGMEERARSLGGRFKVLSEIDHGTCIIVEVKV